MDELAVERQRVITWARKGRITDDDPDEQLAGLSGQGRTLKKELREKQLLTGNRAERLMRIARTYREQVAAGMAEIRAQPLSPEQE